MGKKKFEDFCDDSIREQEFEQFEEDGYVDEEDDEARAFNAGWDAQAFGMCDDEYDENDEDNEFFDEF